MACVLYMYEHSLSFLYFTVNFIEKENNFSDCSISKQQPVQPTSYFSPQWQAMYFAQLDKPHRSPNAEISALISL